MFYVIGLGNPSEKYNGTRHNVGRDVVFTLGGGEQNFSKDKPANAFLARGAEVEWVVPETYMNRSGETALYFKTKHGAVPSDFIVVYDDVDLPVGELKVSVGKGAGGHNGVRSIIDALNSKEFIRIRIGIAPKSFWTGKTKRPAAAALPDFVLKRFSSREQTHIAGCTDTVQTIIDTIVREGVEKAMNRYN